MTSAGGALNDAHGVARVVAALEQLGGEPDLIAGRLRAGGDTGVPAEPESCPVAHHLARTIGVQAAVDARSVCIGDICIGTPDPIAAFVVAYDNGAYPDLEEDPGPIVDDVDVDDPFFESDGEEY